MSTENSGLGDLNQNTPSPASQEAKKKNEKNPMVELMAMLQPMVGDINASVDQLVGVNAAKELAGDLTDKTWNKLSSVFSQNNGDESVNTSGNELGSENVFLSSMSSPDMNSMLGNTQLDPGSDSSGMENVEASVVESSESLTI